MIDITETADGLFVPIKAQPGSRRNGLAGEHAGKLKVCVTAAPEKGKANDAILEVLADRLGLKRSQLSLVRGATASQKTVRVTGHSKAELQQRIATALSQ